MTQVVELVCDLPHIAAVPLPPIHVLLLSHSLASPETFLVSHHLALNNSLSQLYSPPATKATDTREHGGRSLIPFAAGPRDGRKG